MLRLFIALALLAGCTRAAPPPASSAGADARRALAERERRLTAFRLEVETTQGDAVARHEVAFKSPNKSRGRVTAPHDVELAFDGQALVKLAHAEQRYEVVALDLPPAERALFLASTFMPFVPEGYRAPLLPSQVEARRLAHARAPEAVELRITPEPGVTVTYLLRLPAGDFLEKRTEAGGSVKVLSVTAEQCDERLKLCVPTALAESLDGAPLGTTRVTRVELNPELPQAHFSPKAPAGYATTTPTP